MRNKLAKPSTRGRFLSIMAIFPATASLSVQASAVQDWGSSNELSSGEIDRTPGTGSLSLSHLARVHFRLLTSMERIGMARIVNERSEFRRAHQKEMPRRYNVGGGRIPGKNPHHRVVREGVVSFRPSVSVRLIKEMFSMRLHQKMTPLLAASLALVLWGCNSDQVENGSRKDRRRS